MANEATPYISHNPGDLITAEDWNDIQVKVKKDIREQIQSAKEDITETGVERADNADKFDNKTPKVWTDELDQRYATQVHDHEGQAAYRRFIKQFTDKLDLALLRHGLGRFPLVDVYELRSVIGEDHQLKDEEFTRYRDCKLLFYYGHADAEKFDLNLRVYRETVRLGVPFEQMLAELDVAYDDNDTIEDVLNDLWEAFMRDPNDELKHCTTPWVDECCGKRRTVKNLKDADQWSDLYVAILPRKCGKGADLNVNDGIVQEPACQVEIAHVNYDTLVVKANGLTPNAPPLCLMFLLRS